MVTRGVQPWGQRVGAFRPSSLTSREERGARYSVHSPMANDVISHAYNNEASMRTKKDKVGRAAGWVNTWRFRDRGALGAGTETVPFPHSLPSAPPIWPF